MLVARELKEAPYFRAVACRVSESDGQVWLPNDCVEVLGVAAGESLKLLPLP